MAEGLKTLTYKGVAWSTVERFSLQLVQFVISVIMARLLDPSDYGLIGMLAIFMSLSQVFIDGGFSNALIQRKECSDEDFSTVFYINLTISIIVYGLLFLFAPLIASFYEEPLLTSITRVYSLTLIIGSLSAVHNTKLLIDIDFKTQSIISLTSAIVSGVVGIYSAFKGLGVWALVIQALIGTTLGSLLRFFFVKWLPHRRFSINSFRTLFAFGSKLLVAQIISSIYDNLYNLFIGKRFPSNTLGHYTRGNQFSRLVSVNISDIFNRVSFPLFSKVQENDEKLLDIYVKYVKMSVFIIFPLVLGLCGIAKPLVLLLLTDKWLPCVPLLQILCFAYLFNGVIKVNLNLLYVKGRSDLVLKLEIIKKTVAVLILLATIFFDIKIVCLGQVLYSLTALYLNTIYTKKILGFGFLKQMVTVIPYLSLGFVVLIEASIISHVITTPWISLALSLIICTVSYLGLAKLTRLYAYAEIMVGIKNYFKKV